MFHKIYFYSSKHLVDSTHLKFLLSLCPGLHIQPGKSLQYTGISGVSQYSIGQLGFGDNIAFGPNVSVQCLLSTLPKNINTILKKYLSFVSYIKLLYLQNIYTIEHSFQLLYNVIKILHYF